MLLTVCIYLASIASHAVPKLAGGIIMHLKEDYSVPSMILLIVLKGHIGRNEHAHKLSIIRM
jgi:hypothetical protein